MDCPLFFEDSGPAPIKVLRMKDPLDKLLKKRGKMLWMS